jgi:hypothetical protein
MLNCYISYSHTDDKMKETLVLHLAPLERQGLLQLLDDRVMPGEEWQPTLDKRLSEAGIIIVLLSPGYLASHYCMEVEARRALERAVRGEIRLVPVILKRCDWHSTEFGRLQALPKNGRPISDWSKRADAYHGIVLAIRHVLNEESRSHPALPVEQTNMQDHITTISQHNQDQEDSAMTDLNVFISHSSRDAGIAKLLITLIRSALNLSSETIRCTSVNGFRLPAGIPTDEMLRKEIHKSRVFIALITPISIKSTYVLFELGARWGAQKPMIPLLASGANSKHLKGPLSAINVLSCDDPAQLHQFIDDLASVLQMPHDRATAYQKSIDELVEESRKEGGHA